MAASTRRYVIWFTGNNWEERAYLEEVDAAMFVETFADDAGSSRYTWFITDEIGREILIDKGVVSL